jgi:hypothetical protein
LRDRTFRAEEDEMADIRNAGKCDTFPDIYEKSRNKDCFGRLVSKDGKTVDLETPDVTFAKLPSDADKRAQVEARMRSTQVAMEALVREFGTDVANTILKKLDESCKGIKYGLSCGNVCRMHNEVLLSDEAVSAMISSQTGPTGTGAYLLKLAQEVDIPNLAAGTGLTLEPIKRIGLYVLNNSGQKAELCLLHSELPTEVIKIIQGAIKMAPESIESRERTEQALTEVIIFQHSIGREKTPHKLAIEEFLAWAEADPSRVPKDVVDAIRWATSPGW